MMTMMVGVEVHHHLLLRRHLRLLPRSFKTTGRALSPATEQV
jgi:hypothetical protein